MTLFDRIVALKAAGDLAGASDLIPYTGFVGIGCELDAEGLLCRLASRRSNMGNTVLGAIHGGVVGAVLEHTAVMQLLWESELERLPRIVNLSVDYLRPALCADDLLARGTVIKQGRRVANVRVEAWQESPERPVAAAHAHFILG
ncbi:MAG: PaaI family thioesterase [Gammaproteobacteria bacterium]|nr:PaaI family thioesterase [Gammaproteobacteria bacterium]